jgi:PAS domain S-box-containing protein
MAIVWNIYQKKQTTRLLITNKAISHFNKDQAFRFWATAHGGIYVPADKRTPPNPYLKHVAQRDIITVTGKLTLMNPAYMLRQMMEEYSGLYGIKGHITSLKPLRPQNAPDEWEKAALIKLKNGADEVSEFNDINGEPYLRLIRPMITKEGCLKCHAHQGYKVGDLRGGVGVSIPITSYMNNEYREIIELMMSHIIIWGIGVISLYLGFLRLKSQFAVQKQTKSALKESEKKYRLAMEATSDGVWDWNIETDEMFYSKGWLMILAENKVAPVYESWASKIHPHDKQTVHSSLQNHLEGKTAHWQKEHRLQIKADEWKWVIGRGRVVERTTDGTPLRMVGTMTDISDRKLAEAEQEQLQAQLIQAQKMESIGRLAGGVAHDSNNMLSIILGNTEMILEDIDSSNPAISNLIEIKKAAQRSTSITRQLLAFARKQTIDPKNLDLNETLEKMLKMIRRLIGENIDLSWRPEIDLWQIKIDPSQVDQILANLCVNARDAIRDIGKVTIETKNVHFDQNYCWIHAGFKPGDYVMLAVSDNGCGMDKETIDNLFEPFFTTKAVGEGTGLGLATVYGIIKQNNGFINVYSELEEGSTFSAYFPKHAERANREKHKKSENNAFIGHETILLVEDDKAILSITKTMLERLRYTVLAASTVEEALKICDNSDTGEVHLLLTDVVMPKMNGRDLARKILKIHPNLKCLFMSGYTANVIVHHGILNEGVHLISKPFSKQSLSTKLREVLNEV